MSAAAAIALENEQLHAESQERLAELVASRERIVAAGDAERRRLERNLHDGAQQRLVALAMQLRLIQADIRSDPAAAEARVSTASDELAESLGELRELARGLHPAVLEYGLHTALESLAGRSPVPTAVSWDVTDRLPQKIELAAYFVACESLANLAKYAHATTPRCTSRAAIARSSSRSPTTAWAAPTRRPGPGCAASRTASRRSAATCSSPARPARGRS